MEYKSYFLKAFKEFKDRNDFPDNPLVFAELAVCELDKPMCPLASREKKGSSVLQKPGGGADVPRGEYDVHPHWKCVKKGAGGGRGQAPKHSLLPATRATLAVTPVN